MEERLEYGDICKAIINGIPTNVLYIGGESGTHVIIGKMHVNNTEQIFARTFNSSLLPIDGQLLSGLYLNDLEEKYAREILRRRML